MVLKDEKIFENPTSDTKWFLDKNIFLLHAYR